MKTKHDNTRHRWGTAIKDQAFDAIRKKAILETNAEHFLHVLEGGTVFTNLYLRRPHNFAPDMGWLPWPVVPKKQWPPVRFGEKRAITLEEHQAISKAVHRAYARNAKVVLPCRSPRLRRRRRRRRSCPFPPRQARSPNRRALSLA